MAFNRPTLPALIERIQQDIESRLLGPDSRLRRAVLGALSRSLAGTAHNLRGHLDRQSRQIIPDTTEAEILERRLAWWGVGHRQCNVHRHPSGRDHPAAC